MIRYIPQPCDTDPNELESLADFHVSKENERTASILRAYAATLRQQAGRVDEVTDDMVERAWLAYDEAVETCAVSDLPAKLRVAMRAALTAALAQNTQGDGEAVAEIGMYWDLRYFGNEPISKIVERTGAKIGDKLYLHAERARVPDGMVLVPREPTPEMLAAVEGATCSVRVAEDDSAEYPLSEDECAEIYRNMLAAAPSQRAEVK